MFNKKQSVENVSQDGFSTLIGKNTCFEGTLKVEGAIRIDGSIQGEVNVQGDAYIGEGGNIMGNIYATNIVIAGRIEGNVTASEQLRISSTGKILGDVMVKSFIIDEDAFFEGKCTMTQQKPTSTDGPNKDKSKQLKG
ncbi:bactofilin family protein [Natronincola ferrireducens]|uniref:Protein CcmA, bactofilin family n=1 Tax=Natronincola ferrireducens TaxID=393762 RepID=A0A1G9A384_9FIRM|nr:polymer-forming cytoskeletal protein [Natronincola ferrireducens]SDK21798.1 protein CcmA, bactofilin family [Natronincola ferrireducens]